MAISVLEILAAEQEADDTSGAAVAVAAAIAPAWQAFDLLE